MIATNFMYCHTRLWNDVPPRSTAVTVWLAHLVEMEVRRLFLCLGWA
jgi:hypothetical protein